KAFYREHRQIWLRAFIGLLLVFQFAGFVSAFSEHIDPRSILSSRDADAAHVVGTTYKTRWYKDNGESGYASYYYRVAQNFSSISGRSYANTGSTYENGERYAHMVLMTLKLISGYGIALLLASSHTNGGPTRLAMALSLIALFLHHPTRAE